MAQIYNRNNAVNYALTYGKTPNKNMQYFDVYGTDGGDCTNFISQCLFVGGIQMVFDKDPWWYKANNSLDPNDHSWSLSWTLSHSLYWTMKRREKSSDNGPRAIEVDDVKELTLGDIIFYENKEYRINHSGIITGYYQGTPYITQHSPDVVNIHYIKENKTKMHFMKIID